MAVIGLLASCSSGSGPEDDPRLQILVTDAPSDYLETAELWVSRVYLQGGGEEDEESGRIDLFNDPDNPQHFDLLQLQDGLVFELTEEIEVPEGSYAQLRFVLTAAHVTLAEGYTFPDETTEADLQVPSGSSSGVKVQLAGALILDAGEVTTVLVDIAVDDNFVIQGSPGGPGTIQGVLFTPHLVETDREEVEAGA